MSYLANSAILLLCSIIVTVAMFFIQPEKEKIVCRGYAIDQSCKIFGSVVSEEKIFLNVNDRRRTPSDDNICSSNCLLPAELSCYNKLLSCYNKILSCYSKLAKLL